MINRILIPILILILAPIQIHSQSKSNLEAINKIWDKFYEAFESLDYTIMAEIHSKELVRVSGGKRIIGYQTYIENYKTSFQKSKDQNVTNHISLRFFERVNNDSMASERGVYKLIRNKGQSDEKTYYGQFHVIFKKENGAWKITMDYDSNENKSIGEEKYLLSHPKDEFKYFLK